MDETEKLVWSQKNRKQKIESLNIELSKVRMRVFSLEEQSSCPHRIGTWKREIWTPANKEFDYNKVCSKCNKVLAHGDIHYKLQDELKDAEQKVQELKIEIESRRKEKMTNV